MVFNMILLVFCLLVLLILFLIWPAPRKGAPVKAFFGRNFAHRGLHTPDKTVPENSLAAFEAAAAAGYGIELDIQLTKDAEVVVFHDDTLERVCGEKGKVASKTYEELSALRLHGTEERIPLLSEVLELVDGRVPLIVELKQSARRKDLCEQGHEILSAYKGTYCIESFDPRIVGWFKKHAPKILRGQLAAAPRELSSVVSGFIVGTLLCNFISRPHFIAYSKGPRPFTVPIVQSGAMKVVWTVRPEDNVEEIEEENDAVIFEFYHPQPVYKEYQAEEGKKA